MNTNADAIKILCYGDSNTWGQASDKKDRQPANVRWTGQLQRILGEKYYVIEEGLSSRTTDLEYDKKPGRNGKTYLAPCLSSHRPIDIVVLMLGTNDLKTEYNRSARGVSLALKGLVADIREHGTYMEQSAPKIVLVSPIHIDSNAQEFGSFYMGSYNEASGERSLELSRYIADVAQSEGCEFVDAASVAVPGVDGIHLSMESHALLAKLIADKIVQM